MSDILLLLTGAVLVNHFVLTQFPGVRAFTSASPDTSTYTSTGTSNRTDTLGKLYGAMAMAATVTFVVTFTAIGGRVIHDYLLLPFDLVFLFTLTCILLVAMAVGVASIVMQKAHHTLYQAHGLFLALTAANCGVLSVALIETSRPTTFVDSAAQGFGAGAAFSVILILFSAMRERMNMGDVPEPFRGPGITLVTAALMSLAFMGFAGLV
jgi:electron transport complex protein RnfA